MNRFMNSKFSSLLPYVPGEQPQNIANMIKLNTNENPFPPTERAVTLVKEAAIKLNLYSDPECKRLVSAIAKFYGVDTNQVIPSNGSDEVLAFCFQALTEQGAIYNDVTYGIYKVYAQLYNVKSTVIPLKEDFSIDINDYAGKKGTVFLANPNANTGVYLPVDEIEKLLQQDKDRLIIVDEAYCDFGGESTVPLIKKYDNLMVVSTMSKSRSLAGGRLGYAISNASLIAELNKIKFSFNPYNVNTLSILAGAEAFDDVEYFNKNRKTIMENRRYLVEELEKLGFKTIPSRANFILTSIYPKVSGEQYFLRLRERGIIVRYFKEPRIKEYVRITIGTTEQVDALLAATKEILTK